MVDIRHLIRPKCLVDLGEDYTVVPAKPATGLLYITKGNPSFISGHLRMRGRSNGRYPYRYLEMINEVFGPEENAIEVCSNSISNSAAKFTVDINPDCKPDLVCNGEKLEGVVANTFNRWRCDPPYNKITAREIFKTSLPNTHRLLQAGAKIIKPRSLMFLLLSPQNYQICPHGVKRIGWIAITIVPNNELRALHIFFKI